MNRAELDVSVILPVGANEPRSVAYIEQLRSALDEAGYTYEVLLANRVPAAQRPDPLNGILADPTDGGASPPTEMKGRGPESDVLSKAKGKAIVVVGPGLRDDPWGIPRLLAKLTHHDVVIARRKPQSGPLIDRIASRLQGLAHEWWNSPEPLDLATSMKAFRRDAASHFDELGRMKRIRPNLWQICGVSAVAVTVGPWLLNRTQGENDERLHARPLSRRLF